MRLFHCSANCSFPQELTSGKITVFLCCAFGFKIFRKFCECDHRDHTELDFTEMVNTSSVRPAISSSVEKTIFFSKLCAAELIFLLCSVKRSDDLLPS